MHLLVGGLIRAKPGLGGPGGQGEGSGAGELGGRMPGDRMPGAGRAGRAGGPRGCARQVNVFPLVSTPMRGVTW